MKMISFKIFLNEEVNPTASVRSGKIGVDDPAVRDTINVMLNGVTCKSFVTPYIAFERVSKVLAQFHIHLSRTIFLENDSGVVVLPISQFGDKVGMTDNGQVVTKNPDEYHFYFEYRTNDRGLFDVFCEVLDNTELEEIMNDVHDEMDEYSDSDDDAGPQISSAAEDREGKFDHEHRKMYEENDPFKNAKGPSKPSSGQSIHMQAGDKGFTATHSKGTPSSTGLQAKLGFKPNPAYSKQSSASNLVYKSDMKNNFKAVNPVYRGELNNTPKNKLIQPLEEALSVARKILENKE